MNPLSNRFIAAGSTALLGAAGAGALLLVGSTAALANAPLLVTNLDDSGVGSLRQALLDANAAPGGDVITFADEVSGTISLLSDFPTLTEGVDIQGPGASVLAIDGGWTMAGGPSSGHVIFEIRDAPSSVAPWTISGLTITGGNNSSGGGGLFVLNNVDAPVDIHDVEISNNYSQNGGGGVRVIGYGDVSFANATISGNESASGGGALYADLLDFSNLSIADSLITQNISYDAGGALYIESNGNDVAIVGTVVSNNSAGGSGGAIMITDLYTGGSLTVLDAVISGNHSDANGGGLYSNTDDGSIFITDSTISNNTAEGAGGGFYIGSTGLGQIVIANSTVSGNESVLGAGAMQLSGGSKVSLLQSTITSNSGGGANVVGGISVEADDLTVTGSIVAGNAGFDIGDGSMLNTGSISLQSAKSKSSKTLKNRSAITPSGALPPATATSDHSILGEIDPAVTVVDGGGNKVGVVDPMLGPLADNGGPTMTHALLIGSPAIDAGPNPVPTFVGNDFDQRGTGFARIVFGVADAGAFELQEPIAPVVPVVPSFTG
jgi:predicted outer membrane repeat protein